MTSTEVGTYGAAALAIGGQIESLAFMPVLGIGVAATSLVGQALGSWQPQAARQRGNMAIFIGITIMTIMAEPTAREHVSPDRVVYSLPDREVVVQFNAGRYQVS